MESSPACARERPSLRANGRVWRREALPAVCSLARLTVSLDLDARVRP